MSTRCTIGIQYPGGIIRSVYCHHDGYPQGVGRTLVDHYRTVERVDALMQLGDLSWLGYEPVSHTREEHDAFSRHTPAEEVIAKCLAYGAWRGDDLPACEDDGRRSYVRSAESTDVEYLYLYDAMADVWLVYRKRWEDYEFTPVEDLLAR